VSSINKTDRHDITEILLKVALKTIALTLILNSIFKLETHAISFKLNALLPVYYNKSY